MKKLAATFVAVLALLSLASPAPVEAQATPSGDALKTVADNLRNALLSGTPEELLNQLAPWLRGRVELFDERLPDELKEMLEEFPEEERAEFEEMFKAAMVEDAAIRDPKGVLGIKTFDDILALSPAQMYSMDLGHLQFHADEEVAAHRTAKWHEVNRAIFTRTEDLEWTDEDEIERTYGKISFVNRFLDIIEITCVAEGSTWQVIDFNTMIGDWDLELFESEMMEDPTFEIFEGEVVDAKRSEAEQLLGSARDQARVEYAKTGAAPKALTDSMSEEDFEAYFTGVYFKLRARIYKKPDMERGAIVAEPVDDESLGYGVLYFNYAEGGGDFEWYDSEEDLEEALKNFQTAK